MTDPGRDSRQSPTSPPRRRRCAARRGSGGSASRCSSPASRPSRCSIASSRCCRNSSRAFSPQPGGGEPVPFGRRPAALALAMFGAGALSDAYGRKRVMARLARSAAAATTLAAAFAPNWPTLIALRALTGLALAGAARRRHGLSRRGDGPLGGRAVDGPLHRRQHARRHGRPARGGGDRGILGLALGAGRDRRGLARRAAAFAFALPRERRATPKAELVAIGPAIRMHLGDPGPAPALFALGFLLMGAFVTTYNYIGFHLAAPPFSLSQTAIGFVFVIYLLGAVASAVAGDLCRALRPQAGHPARGGADAARRRS